MVPYGENQAYPKHIPHERASPIADERQRNPRDWQQANGHADILEYMEGDHADDPDANIGIKRISRLKAGLR